MKSQIGWSSECSLTAGDPLLRIPMSTVISLSNIAQKSPYFSEVLECISGVEADVYLALFLCCSLRRVDCYWAPFFECLISPSDEGFFSNQHILPTILWSDEELNRLSPTDPIVLQVITDRQELHCIFQQLEEPLCTMFPDLFNEETFSFFQFLWALSFCRGCCIDISLETILLPLPTIPLCAPQSNCSLVISPDDGSLIFRTDCSLQAYSPIVVPSLETSHQFLSNEELLTRFGFALATNSLEALVVPTGAWQWNPRRCLKDTTFSISSHCFMCIEGYTSPLLEQTEPSHELLMDASDKVCALMQLIPQVQDDSFVESKVQSERRKAVIAYHSCKRTLMHRTLQVLKCKLEK